MVKAPNWLSHLEYDWRSPVWRHWWEELAKDHLLLRFDQRGCGLSDWAAADLSFAARMLDLEAVVDATGLDCFAILGISQGGACAIEYAVRYPERVTHLVLYGAFGLGFSKRQHTPEELAEHEALMTLMRQGWGRDDPTYRQIFTSRFMPDASPEQMQRFNELQRVSASPENAVRTQYSTAEIDVLDRLGQVSVPTLVLHSRDDGQVPFAQGRQLAAMIPNAHFVPLESKNHILPENEPAWPMFLSEVSRFLSTPTVGQPSAATTRLRRAADEELTVMAQVKPKDAEREAYSLIDGLDSVSLSRFSVIPGYARFDEVTRNGLKDARQVIAEGLERPSRKRENHLFWAAPGSGKTYFVQRIVASLPGNINYQEINLAGCGETDFLSLLENIENDDRPCLCFIDELDAKPEEFWPYEVLLPRLDAALERAVPLVFVMAGSSGSSIEEMKQRIGVRSKGMDLLSRIPGTNEHQIPAMSVGDRLLVALTQFREAGKESGNIVEAVEKLGLYYVAVTPGLASARQLREFAVRAVERIPPGEDRIKYDNLFSPGDLENKTFWSDAAPVAGDLVNRFVAVED